MFPQEEHEAKDGKEELEVNEKGEGAERAAASTSSQEAADMDEDCDDLFDNEEETEEEEEEAVDFDLRVRCPLFKICAWFGALGTLERHVRETHDDITKKSANFVCKSLKDNVLIILYVEEVFLYYKCIKENGMWCTVVQQLGTINKRYKYTNKLLSVENIIGPITFRFRVGKIEEETSESVFSSSRCMAVEQSVFKAFHKKISNKYNRHDRRNCFDS